MILLTSFLHRGALKDIIFQWMTNKLVQEDCLRVKKIINFNVHAINLYLDSICGDLFAHLSGQEAWSFEVNAKGEFRDFILKVAPYRNDRLDHLAARYQKYPEDFYRSSPFHARIYCTGRQDGPTYLGHSRIKRFRRVAEKASRRMINIIFDQVKKRADDLALERASRLSIPKEKLVTPIEQQVEEFNHAERRFIKDLKKGMFYPDEQIIKSARMHDVAGIKVIIDDDKEPFFESFFREKNRFRILEKESHSGLYNAANYIIEYRLDKDMLLENAPGPRVIHVLSARGMKSDSLIEDYRQFIKNAEDTVMIEVITSNYQEMIESEMGRCMHEDRIMVQREQLEYRSSIARNVRYITEFMFLFAVSGKSCIQELPIKLWEKVMPDTYDHSIRALWDIPTTPVL